MAFEPEGSGKVTGRVRSASAVTNPVIRTSIPMTIRTPAIRTRVFACRRTKDTPQLPFLVDDTRLAGRQLFNAGSRQVCVIEPVPQLSLASLYHSGIGRSASGDGL